MNIFEYLGLPANHRAEDKITHKVKNYHEIPDAKKKWPAVAQAKEDGVHAICVIGGEGGGSAIFSRTGKRVTNVGHLELMLNRMARDNDHLKCKVISAELCSNILSLEELSGAVNPNRVEQLTNDTFIDIGSSYLVCFDIMQVAEFKDGKSIYGYFSRLRDLKRYLSFNVDKSLVKLVQSDVVENEEQYLEYTKQLTDQGAEGAVLKQDFIWQAGKKDHCMAKAVRGVDFDLEVVDFEEGKGKRQGMVANLIVRWRMYGKPAGDIDFLRVDGRFTDEQRIRWWTGEDRIIGKIVHVHALQLGSKGSLRLAKVHSVRIDKDVADL